MRRLELAEADARRGGGDDLEGAAQLARVLEGRDVGRDPPSYTSDRYSREALPLASTSASRSSSASPAANIAGVSQREVQARQLDAVLDHSGATGRAAPAPERTWPGRLAGGNVAEVRAARSSAASASMSPAMASDAFAGW